MSGTPAGNTPGYEITSTFEVTWEVRRFKDAYYRVAFITGELHTCQAVWAYTPVGWQSFSVHSTNRAPVKEIGCIPFSSSARSVQAVGMGRNGMRAHDKGL